VENHKPVCVGEFLHSVDPKSRVAIPHAFRKEMRLVDGDKVVMARGPDCCIEVHTSEGWRKHIEEVMGGVSLYDPQARRLRRTRLSRSREVELDSQGRMLIPKNLKEMAGITDSAVIIGVGPFFEVWEPNRYQTYFGLADSQYDNDLMKIDRLKSQGEQAAARSMRAESVRDDVPRAGDGQ
jgi:MraZ protein